MSASAILELRQQKYYSCFAQAELRHILQTNVISAGAQKLWLAISNETGGNRALKIKLTMKQLGGLIMRSACRVQKLVKELNEKGYLLSSQADIDGILTHELCLPESALKEIQQAPNRGEQVKTRRSFLTPTPVENNVPPLSKTPPLINKYNNKNNHMSVSHANDLQEAKRLHQRSEHLWNIEFVNISCPRERAKRVDQQFTAEELNLIAGYVEGNESAPEPPKKPRPPKTQPATHSQQVNIQGEQFSVEPEVKKLVCTQIPKLVATQQVKGRAANLSTTELQREALFYATKAGSRGDEIIDQRHRFFIFRKLCIDGTWQQPKGMLNREIIQREKNWAQVKKEERENARKIMGQLQSMPKASTVAAALC